MISSLVISVAMFLTPSNILSWLYPPDALFTPGCSCVAIAVLPGQDGQLPTHVLDKVEVRAAFGDVKLLESGIEVQVHRTAEEPEVMHPHMCNLRMVLADSDSVIPEARRATVR